VSILENARICAQAEKVVARCKKLAAFSEDVASTRRTFLCPAMRDCHREIIGWLSAVGADVTVDAAGNLRGFYAGAHVNGPRLLLGSHLDTVPNAGAYDGVLGVVVAVAILEALEGRRLPFGIEIIGFSEEEGVRFGTPFIGSRALVGRLDEEFLNQRDVNGTSIRAAIEKFGLNPSEIARAMLSDDTLAYLEFHIEQGPVLESLGLGLGVVEAIAGQTRMEFIFLGRSNHAGTTPMHLRHDAIAAAAEWIVAVEHTAKSHPGLVATVGQVEAEPGATNVIARKARATVDLRHASDDVRDRVADMLVRQAEELVERRGLSLRRKVLLRQSAVAMDPFLVEQIAGAIRRTGGEPHRLVSGAGHDAMILAEKIPVGMVFLRTTGGISHDPAEAVETEDVAKALECGLHLLDQLASSSEFLKRMCRA
jgi:allantoate deiminase